MTNRIYNARAKRAAAQAANARREGAEARCQEKSAWTCPYTAFSLPARMWLEGWQDADAQIEIHRNVHPRTP